MRPVHINTYVQSKTIHLCTCTRIHTRTHTHSCKPKSEKQSTRDEQKREGNLVGDETRCVLASLPVQLITPLLQVGAVVGVIINTSNWPYTMLMFTSVSELTSCLEVGRSEETKPRWWLVLIYSGMWRPICSTDYTWKFAVCQCENHVALPECERIRWIMLTEI